MAETMGHAITTSTVPKTISALEILSRNPTSLSVPQPLIKLSTAKPISVRVVKSDAHH